MKPISYHMTKLLHIGSILKIIDNSGVTKAKIIGVKRYGGVKNRYPRAGIADIVICSVTAGKPELKHTVVPAVIVQQKGAFKRADGTTIRFYTNAGIILKSVEEGEPKGSVIKEAIAKEVIDRFVKIGKGLHKMHVDVKGFPVAAVHAGPLLGPIAFEELVVAAMAIVSHFGLNDGIGAFGPLTASDIP